MRNKLEDEEESCVEGGERMSHTHTHTGDERWVDALVSSLLLSSLPELWGEKEKKLFIILYAFPPLLKNV